MFAAFCDTRVARSSDVFGLAVVVWEMLAGHRLFRGENGHDTLRNVLYAEAPLLSDVDGPIGLFRKWSKQFYSAPGA